jgi:hypothetical protein
VSITCLDSINHDILADGTTNFVRDVSQLIWEHGDIEVADGGVWNVISGRPGPTIRARREDGGTIDQEVFDLLFMGTQAGVEGFLTLHFLVARAKHSASTVAELEHLPGALKFFNSLDQL